MGQLLAVRRPGQRRRGHGTPEAVGRVSRIAGRRVSRCGSTSPVRAPTADCSRLPGDLWPLTEGVAAMTVTTGTNSNAPGQQLLPRQPHFSLRAVGAFLQAEPGGTQPGRLVGKPFHAAEVQIPNPAGK